MDWDSRSDLGSVRMQFAMLDIPQQDCITTVEVKVTNDLILAQISDFSYQWTM
jgi:hypothetical protein